MEKKEKAKVSGLLNLKQIEIWKKYVMDGLIIFRRSQVGLHDNVNTHTHIYI